MLPMLQIFGKIEPPPGVSSYIGLAPQDNPSVPGLVQFLTTIIRLMIVGAGLFTLFNIILAGYAFLSAGDDSKAIANAWAKIWQSVLGLAIAAGSLVLAAIIGWLVFKDVGALLYPRIYGP